MNPEPCCKKTGAGLYVLGLAGSFLVMAALVWLMRSYTHTAAPSEVRAEERRKNMHDFQALNAPLLKDYAWQDPTKDIVRVPVDRAMELVLAEWQNPVAGRSNLLARAAKAFAPAAVEKNKYE